MYVHTHTHLCIPIWVWLEIGICRGPPPPPLLQTFVAGPLLQTLVARLRVDYCSLSYRLVAGRVCRKTADSVTGLIAKPPQSCYKPDVFETLPYVSINRRYMQMHIHVHVYIYRLHHIIWDRAIPYHFRPHSIMPNRITSNYYGISCRITSNHTISQHSISHRAILYHMHILTTPYA